MGVLRTVWQGFRGLPGVIQLVLGIGVLLALGLLGGAGDAEVVADGPATTSAEPRPTTAAAAPSTASTSTTLRPSSTTAPPSTTTTSSPTTSATAGAPPPPAAVVAAPAGDVATVGRIVDGDTLQLADGTRVRLIGIDTPESVDPGSPVECFGVQASRRLGELLPPGTAIRLEYDVERLDRFGRTLAYVHRAADRLFVNEAMVLDGYAVVATFPPNVRYVDRFVAFQRQATEATAASGAAAEAPTRP